MEGLFGPERQQLALSPASVPRALSVGPGVLVEAPVIVAAGPDFADLEWGVRELSHAPLVGACELEQLLLEDPRGPGYDVVASRVPVLAVGSGPQALPETAAAQAELRFAGLEVIPERRVIWRARACCLRRGRVYVFRAVPRSGTFGRCGEGPWSMPFCVPETPGIPNVPEAEATATAELARCIPFGVGLVRVSWQVDAFAGGPAALLEVSHCDVEQRPVAAPAEAIPSKCRCLLPPRAAAKLECATGFVQAWECVAEVPVETKEALLGHRHGLQLQFRVRAWNQAGYGPWSDWSRQVSCNDAARVKLEVVRASGYAL